MSFTGRLRELERAFARYSREERAPSWVRALQLAERPVDLSRSVQRTRVPAPAGGSALASWGPAATQPPILPSMARAFSRENEWVRTAINRLKGRCGRGEWAILPLNSNRPFDELLQREITFLLANPDIKNNSFRVWIEAWLDDHLTLGKGGYEYVFNYRGRPLSLEYFDAQYLTINPAWDGSNPNMGRYIWKPGRETPVSIKNYDLTLAVVNVTTYRPESTSYIETLYDTIEADSAGNSFVRSMMKRYPPPGWIHLGPRASPKLVNSVRERLQHDILGRAGILVTGGFDNEGYTNLWQGNSKDNELMAWSIYFARKVAAVYGISPRDFGVTEDINRSTASSEEDRAAEDGYKSMLMLVEMYINRETVFKFGPPEEINLGFFYKELTMKDRLRLAKQIKDLTGGIPIVMLNEARAEAQYPPLELGDAIYVQASTGTYALIGPDAEEYNRRRAEELGDQAAAVAAAGGNPAEGVPTPEGEPTSQPPAPEDQLAAAGIDPGLLGYATTLWSTLWYAQRRDFVAAADAYARMHQAVYGEGLTVSAVAAHVAGRFGIETLVGFFRAVQGAVWEQQPVPYADRHILEDRNSRYAALLAAHIQHCLVGFTPEAPMTPVQLGVCLHGCLQRVAPTSILAAYIAETHHDRLVMKGQVA